MREEISVGKKQKKTNVMRILDQKKIPYTAKEYPHEEGVGHTMYSTFRWRRNWT